MRRNPGERMDALVADAHLRWSVAGIRGLGRAGLRVVALGPAGSSPGLWSRYAEAREVGPDSAADPAGFAAAVGEVAARYGPLVVYPGNEEAIDALLDGPAVPPEVTLPYPGAGPTQRLRDKSALPELAAEAGLRTPATLARATVAELRRQAPPAPCVVKPVRPTPALEHARVIESEAGLRSLLAQLPESELLLVQERATAPLVGLALVVDREGAVAARFQQVARRTWPPEAGGSSLAVSVEPDEELVSRASRMLRAVGYWGLAHVQFLTTDGGQAVIDVNPRFYGSLPLALAAGVNLPAAWHAVALGQPRVRPRPYRTGVAYRWLEAELGAAFRGSRRELFERPPAPRSGAMWAPDDPLPSALLAAATASAKVKRRLPLRKER
jgi:predicted ATP-grasp superfamily ATP-dependent carboligase